MNTRHLESWKFEHEGLICEVVRWETIPPEETDEQELRFKGTYAPTWNSYVYAIKGRNEINDALFNLVENKGTFTMGGKERTRYDVNEEKLSLYGGITYCNPEYDGIGDIGGFKIGNDFNHIWNKEYEQNFEEVKKQLILSVDRFVEKQNVK